MSLSLPAIEGGRPVRSEFLAIGLPDISEAEKQEVMDTLSGTWLSKGPKVQIFQRDFAAYVQSPRALALSSCTAALHLALLAAGVGEGDEVIVPSLTFVATANAVVYVGAKPVLVDVEPDTLLISLAAIERALSPRTRALIPVHLYGRPCPMGPLMELARSRKLAVIEDAAHAVGTEDEGRKIGSIGDFTCFSFYATKNICTGDGGMVTCRDDVDSVNRMEVLSLHGMSTDAWKRFSPEGNPVWGMVDVGYKYNMMDLQAALGIQQLKRLEGFLTQRRELVEHYRRLLTGVQGVRVLADDPPSGRHAHHLFPVLLDVARLKIPRDQFLSALKAENIGGGIHYHALHYQPYYRERFSLRPEDFPVASAAHDALLTLPLHTLMTLADVEMVVAALSKLLNYYRR